MNPYERRIIHSSLQDNEDVTTYSIGQEPYRKVVIAPKNRSRTDAAADTEEAADVSREAEAVQPSSYERREKPERKSQSTATYKADFKPQQHKAEYKNFEEYLAAHSKD